MISAAFILLLALPQGACIRVQSYDFIVVGGGSSGSILAGILAFKGPTALLERGPAPQSYPQHATRPGWPQISAIASNAVRAQDSGHWMQSPAVLGGSSTIDGGACWRGNISMLKSLGYDETAARSAFDWLEAQLCQPTADNEYSKSIEASWAEIGLRNASNDGQSSGVSNGNASATPFYRRGRSLFAAGKRRTATYTFEGGYMAGSRGNLTVMTYTTAKRILFERSHLTPHTSHQYEAVTCICGMSSMDRGKCLPTVGTLLLN